MASTQLPKSLHWQGKLFLSYSLWFVETLRGTRSHGPLCSVTHTNTEKNVIAFGCNVTHFWFAIAKLEVGCYNIFFFQYSELQGRSAVAQW